MNRRDKASLAWYFFGIPLLMLGVFIGGIKVVMMLLPAHPV